MHDDRDDYAGYHHYYKENSCGHCQRDANDDKALISIQAYQDMFFGSCPNTAAVKSEGQ